MILPNSNAFNLLLRKCNVYLCFRVNNIESSFLDSTDAGSEAMVQDILKQHCEERNSNVTIRKSKRREKYV